MIDIHSHILFGVDDGPATLDDSVKMCDLAAADGCEVMIATPHLRHGRWPDQRPSHLLATLLELQDRVGGALDIRLGGEVRIDSALLEDLEAPRSSTCIPLADSDYLLLEFSRDGIGPTPDALIHEVLLQGWRPILAHPEFIPTLSNDRGLMNRLADMGALFQVTAMSITGDFGRRARKTVTDLIDSGLVHFVASDAHGPTGRPPGLSRARREISRRWGEETARQLTDDNPRAVVENRPVAVPAAQWT